MQPTPDDIRAVMAHLGQRGGRARSQAKADAARRNGAKAGVAYL